jgi:peptide methionine sulfoxide reductase msrA/msrB
MKRTKNLPRIITIILLSLFCVIATSCIGEKMKKNNITSKNMSDFVTKQCGTEPAFSNLYWDEHRPGIYVDINTGKPLFSSLDKFDSGTGWPSFTKPLQENIIKEKTDDSAGMQRTEVRTDESHLGHVFDDGPNGSLRYCINSAALRFIPFENLDEQGFGNYSQIFHFETATLSAGCFWGVEELLSKVPGVIKLTVGYTGGITENPTYEDVSSGKTGHAEAVEIVFDPKVLSYRELLDYFWRLHDPTQKNMQGYDIGTQYRSAIFYHDEDQRKIAEKSILEFNKKKIFDNPAVTEILAFKKFYPAEDYHQDYYKKHRGLVCHALRSE